MNFPSFDVICQGDAVETDAGDPRRTQMDDVVDPVRVRRTAIARWTSMAHRLGYAFYGLAIGIFILAFATEWSGAFTAIITACLVLGSILLAPAIVLGYAIKAAEREEADIERRRRGPTGK